MSNMDRCRWVVEDGHRFHVPGCWSGVFDERQCDCSKKTDSTISMLERIEKLEAEVKRLKRAPAHDKGEPKP